MLMVDDTGNEIDPEYIRTTISEGVDNSFELIGGFWGLIDLIDGLTPGEKRWAKNNLQVHVIICDPLDDNDQIRLPEELKTTFFIYDGDKPIRDVSDYIREEEERKLD